MASKRRRAAGGATAPPAVEDFDFARLHDALDGLAVAVGHEQSLNDLRGYISTGCFVLDAEIGEGRVVGGYPMGRFTELFGTEGVGKSSLATAAMVSAQQGRGTLLRWREDRDEDGRVRLVATTEAERLKPGLVVLADSEFKWPVDRAQRMGLNVEQLIRIKPKIVQEKSKDGKVDVVQTLTVEHVLSELEKTILAVCKNPYFQRPDVPVLFVWDSLAASPIEVELEGDGLQEGIASKARKVRAAMRRMTGQLAAHNITVLVVNQVYDKIGGYGGKEASAGRGLKFHSSHRIEVYRGSGGLVESNRPVGILAKAKCVKSSICAPTHETAVPIRFSTGVDDDRALLDFFISGAGKKNDAVRTSGSWIKVTPPGSEEEISFQYGSWGDTLAKYDGLREHLRGEVMKTIRGE